jgi:hypothetical protein
MSISASQLARRILTPLILLFITYNTLLFYGFAGSFILYPLLFIFLVIYLWIDWKNGLALALSLLGATLLVNLLLGFVKIEDRMYYRPHEKLTVYNHEIELKSYKKNADITVLTPFGDAGAVGNVKDIELEPRKIRFKTDSLGFRNNSDYRGEKYVLVGDSFTVGNGTSQEDILTSQLKEKYHKETYEVAYAGGIPEYVKYILYFQKRYGHDFKVLLFLFEGNDFPESVSRRQLIIRKPAFKAIRDRYKAFFEETILYRYTYSLIAKRTKRLLGAEALVVNGHKMADFTEYVSVTRREEYRIPERIIPMLSLVRNRIDHIFFIPTKYRVYYPFLDKDNQKPLPNAQWEAVKALSQKLNVGCTDLTGPLIDASRLLLKEDKYTFWKDDSHWNRHGIAVAARVVSDYIDSREASAPK